MPPVSRRTFVAASLTLMASTVLRAAEIDSESSIALRRSATLNRGINLSGWYGGWGDYSPEHIATWTTPTDLQFIHSIGLQYVRLCIDPVQLTTGGYNSPASVAALARLDKSIDDILTAGLALSITIFPRSDYKKALLTSEGEAAFLDLWKFLATHFGPRDPERVFFDLLNEPEIEDAAKWNAIQASVVDAIRGVDTVHTLIATGNKYAGIDELIQVNPLRDSNIIYTFHFYEPFQFTHQGATWSTPALAHLHNVPYPALPWKLGPMIASAKDIDARNMLTDYANEAWDSTVILRRLKIARAWADAHRVPVICNEFGAFRDTIPDKQRALYLHDDRTLLESLQIPWAEWDYRGNFGIVSKSADGAIIPDVLVIEALGLKLPPAIPASVMPADESMTAASPSATTTTPATSAIPKSQ